MIMLKLPHIHPSTLSTSQWTKEITGHSGSLPLQAFPAAIALGKVLHVQGLHGGSVAIVATGGGIGDGEWGIDGRYLL